MLPEVSMTSTWSAVSGDRPGTSPHYLPAHLVAPWAKTDEVKKRPPFNQMKAAGSMSLGARQGTRQSRPDSRRHHTGHDCKVMAGLLAADPQNGV
eukprot:317520-Amphidinium_carterae.1